MASSSPQKVKRQERLVAYDFKRPDRVGKEQIRALQTIHEVFSRNFGAALSSMIRSVVDVQLVCVDQLTYGEFVTSLENPTCLTLLRAAPLDGNLILEISPKILFPVIDRLMGGGKEQTLPMHRPMTEIELRLVSRVTKLFLQELRHAWESIISLELSAERVESNPHLVQIVPPNEVIVLISFELTIGQTREMMNLCVPYNSIERINQKLEANSWLAYGKAKTTSESIATLARQLEHLPLELVVTLAETRITANDLLSLRVGDVIATEKDIYKPVDVSLGGVSKFAARLGSHKGRMAIQIERNLETDQ